MQRFIPGQKLRRLPGGSLNRALDLVEKQGQFGPPPGPGDRPPTFDTPVLIVPCKNTSGVALPERAIVGVDVSAFTAPDITPGSPDANDADAAILRGVPVEIKKPDATTHASKWGVTLGPIGTTAPHNVGHLVISGLVWARVNVTNAAHKCVMIETDDYTYLKSAASGMAIWDRKLAGTGKQWALVLLGGGGEKKRAIRGTWQSGTTTLVIDSIYLLDSGLDPRAVPGDLAETLNVTNVAGDTYSSGDKVYADYNDDLDRWEARPKGSAGTTPPPLRRFELTANKLRADATATAKFLDDAGNMVGSDETLHDPELIFSGRAANYVGTIDGFRGVALKRTDLGGLEADRWEIVAMEGFAEWVVLTYAGSPDNEWQLTSFGGNQWHYKRPVADGEAITVADPLTTLVSPQDGDMLIAHLSNPDTDPPTYQERERRRAWVSGVGGGSGIATIHSVDSIDISIVGSDLKVKINYTSYIVDSAGTSGTGSTEDTLALTSKTINNPTSIELNDTGTTLESKLNYTPITAKFIDASDGTATNSNDSVPLTTCP